MDEQVLKELKLIASLRNWSTSEAEYVLSHLPDLLAEILRLRQYEQAWSDYQIWLKRERS